MSNIPDQHRAWLDGLPLAALTALIEQMGQNLTEAQQDYICVLRRIRDRLAMDMDLEQKVPRSAAKKFDTKI